MHYSERRLPAPRVQRLLSLYADTARHPDLPPFVTSALLPIDQAVQGSVDRSGVYMLYRDDRTLIYIGMSLRSVASRLLAHASARERRSAFWSERPFALAQTVLVPNPWEGPSLEEFLVRKAEDAEL